MATMMMTTYRESISRAVFMVQSGTICVGSVQFLYKNLVLRSLIGYNDRL